MTNAIVPAQYQQYAPQSQIQPQGQYAQQPQAVNSVGAVNIQIYNPTAQNNVPAMYPTANFYGQSPQYLPYPYPYPYPVPQQVQAPAPQPPAVPAPAPEKKDEKSEKKVLLTDDYIKTLENYLNNENPKTRMMGIKEVMARFKEDKSRKTDIALTALLNKALQDQSASVRFMALTTLDVGYATGNDESINILKQIQTQSGQQYGEDALLASQILLKASGEVVDAPAGTGHSVPKETKKEEVK